MKTIWRIFSRFFRSCLQLAVKPFHIEITDARWAICEQFIKFAIVGCSNAGVTLLVYDATVLVFGAQYYMMGQTIGYLAGIGNSFFLNSHFVFCKKSDKKFNAFLKMCGCYGITYFIQIGLLYLFVETLKVPALIGPVFAIIITTPINFLLNKLWTFRENKGN